MSAAGFLETAQQQPSVVFEEALQAASSLTVNDKYVCVWSLICTSNWISLYFFVKSMCAPRRAELGKPSPPLQLWSYKLSRTSLLSLFTPLILPQARSNNDITLNSELFERIFPSLTVSGMPWDSWRAFCVTCWKIKMDFFFYSLGEC